MRGIERFLLENPGHTVKILYSPSGWLNIPDNRHYKFLLSGNMFFGIGVMGESISECDATLWEFLNEPR